MLDDYTIQRIYDTNKLGYHNWTHISRMLMNAHNFKESLDEDSWYKLEQAIKFHDIIYVPGAADNEEKSAKAYLLHQVKTATEVEEPKLASPSRRALSAVPLAPKEPEAEDPVVSLIMATKNHRAVKTIDNKLFELSKIIVDLDLWGLGDSWADYVSAGKRIRSEYINAGFTDEQFDIGRKSFIRRFLDRESIFLTEFCEDRELRAIYNLKKELYLLNLKSTNGLPLQQ